MRVVLCTLFVTAVLAASIAIMPGTPLRAFLDVPSLFVVWTGTIFFMATSYSPSELKRWLWLSFGVRQPIEAWEHRLAKRMCLVAGSAALVLGLLNVLIGGVVVLTHLTDPTAIGPALAVMVLSPLYALFLAGLVIAAMWAQLSRHEL